MAERETMIGRVIGGRYKVEKILGRGGMAEVYKAYQETLDRHVAVKLMHTFLADDADFLARFQREARAVAGLRHPNIIQVYDFDTEGDTTYMVMEFIDGPTLKEIIEELRAKNETLPMNESIEVIKNVGMALEYAHRKGMIHRDVKPANVMRDSAGRTVLTDFGIVKLMTGPQYTATGSLVGTPSYMAPEQGLGQPGDARTDIYSLGVMLYQLVTGRLPYESDTPMAVVFKHINDPLPLPSTINPELPPGIEKVILKALAKDPNERYQSAREMVDHLNNLDRAAELTIPTSTLTGLKALSSTAGVTDTAAGRTRIGGGTSGASTMVGAGDKTARPSGGNNAFLWIGGLIGAFALIAIVAGALIFGPGLLAGPVAPTVPPTEAVQGTPTPELAAILLTERAVERTQQAETAEANQATLAAALATETLTPTPNFTATLEACDFVVDVTEEEPAPGSRIPVGGVLELALTLQNNGTCDLPADLTLAYVSGTADTATSVPVGALAVGASTSVVFSVATGGTAGPFEFVLALESDQIGSKIVDAELDFAYELFVLPTNTPRPVLPTSTPRPAQPTATATPGQGSGGGGTGGTPLGQQAGITFLTCDYASAVPGGPRTDYVCQVNINFSGGVAPWRVIMSGGGDADFVVADASSSRATSVRGRRCLTITGTIRVIDATGAEANGSFAFDPYQFRLFPPSSTNVCGDGDS